MTRKSQPVVVAEDRYKPIEHNGTECNLCDEPVLVLHPVELGNTVECPCCYGQEGTVCVDPLDPTGPFVVRWDRNAEEDDDGC